MADREYILHRLKRESLTCNTGYYARVPCDLLDEVLEFLKGSQWVSVKDQMPEELRDVLVARNGCMFVMTLINKEGENYWEDDYGFYQEIDESDYWKPLPEQPEVKQDD